MNELDRKHKENLENFKEIRDIFDTHAKADEEFQKKMNTWFERTEPMVKAFENKRIEHMVYDKQRKTLYVYAKEVTVMGGALAAIYGFFKFISMR